MAKNLLIVESPAKAKTIEKLLGNSFSVKSSYGHIRDLKKDKTAIDIANGFLPDYEITPDKYKVVKELREAVAKADEVWLATDEDREGEAISWHLCKVLGLNEQTTKRIVFHEITKPALQKAVQNPRTVDINLVDAQQARRVLDRLVGFELSGLLWKKIKSGLSAGRVQSVAVRLIVDREREIQNHNSKSFYRIIAIFNAVNTQGKLQAFKAELPTRYENEADAEVFLQKCINATFSVSDIQVKPAKRSPAPPFTTSTLQQEASRKFGYGVQRTMSLAQKLYEEGHITYMRTDSVTLSDTALQDIATAIEKEFGKDYSQIRRHKNKNESAQEAHEAIRPTYIENAQIPVDRDLQRLYELIRKRTLASQMADAQLEKTTIDIAISTQKDVFLKAEGEVIKFDGFLKVYIESNDSEDTEEEKEGMLPLLKKGQIVDFVKMTAKEGFTKAAARYTEASLVKKLEELGIGRPSTYAPTISRIMEESRGYVVRETREGEKRNARILTLQNNTIDKKTTEETHGAEKNKLFPTSTGMVVTDFLSEHFQKVMDFSFTANVEAQLDEVAEGQKNWQKLIGEIYSPFHADIVKTSDEAERATGERILGKHPETGLTVLARLGKFGALVQLGTSEELGEAKPKYANLKKEQSLDSITLDEALELFILPKELGLYQNETLIIGIGRLGPYVRFADKFVSIPRDEDPLSVTLERAIELVDQKNKEDAPIGFYDAKPITKGKGRFGPFIKWNEMFINIPVRFNFDTISEAQCAEIIEAKVEKEANRYIHQWKEENITVENGRWGAFIRFGKNNFKLAKDIDVATLTLEQVKAIITAQDPKAFEQKKPAAKKTDKAAPKTTKKTK